MGVNNYSSFFRQGVNTTKYVKNPCSPLIESKSTDLRSIPEELLAFTHMSLASFNELI